MKSLVCPSILSLHMLLPVAGRPQNAAVAPERRTAAPEALSLFGAPLYAKPLPVEEISAAWAAYREAEAVLRENPSSLEAIVWLGRRAAYLWRYKQAIEIFSDGLKRFPNSPELLRHRGHRYITIRRFGLAVADLENAAALTRGHPDRVEPDGQPNKYHIPRSTLQTNIWYHLGLAYYLLGDFNQARSAFLTCLQLSKNDDMLVATADWLYMTLRRLGRDEEARQLLSRIRPQMEILENTAYHRRLLMYKIIIPADSLLRPATADALDLATYGYGVGNWHYYNGRIELAKRLFERVLAGGYWPAFGYIAAEAELFRLRENGD